MSTQQKQEPITDPAIRIFEMGKVFLQKLTKKDPSIARKRILIDLFNEYVTEINKRVINPLNVDLSKTKNLLEKANSTLSKLPTTKEVKSIETAEEGIRLVRDTAEEMLSGTPEDRFKTFIDSDSEIDFDDEKTKLNKNIVQFVVKFRKDGGAFSSGDSEVTIIDIPTQLAGKNLMQRISNKISGQIVDIRKL